MKVWLIGAGCGGDTLTAEARCALEKAELILGTKRLLDLVPETAARRVGEYRPAEIVQLLETEKPERACVLLSGDTGFYSGAAKLLPRLTQQGIETRVLPGISALQVLSARLGMPWQDWRLCTAHGVPAEPVYEVMQGRPVFFLTSGAKGPAALCRELTETGLGSLPVAVGENLGMPGEAVTKATAADCVKRTFAPLNVLLVGPAPAPEYRTPGIPDEAFLRGAVPMTKQEVRGAILAKLGVQRSDLCWDIGGGTGSVAVELALQSRGVYSVEQDPAALALMEQNREQFRAWNLRIVPGTAPAALEALPAPDAVFVGGSGGHLEEILETVHRSNPKARICVSAIALETLQKASETLTRQGRRVEIVQISVSRAKTAGELHLLLAQNPVFLITGAAT